MIFANLKIWNILLLERTGDSMFKTIPIWEVDHYINYYSDIMIIDLRSQSSYRQSHIQGAVNLPYEDMDRWVSSLPKDKLLIFYCSRGGQSMMACRKLEQSGYNVVNIANGIAYYRGKYMVRG
jgi:rhodanese-related sulfurtransferase